MIQYPGYGRLRYFLTSLIITAVFYAVLFVVVIAAFRSLGVSESVSAAAGIGIFLLALFMTVVSLYVAYQRVKNLGMSGWALLWTIVPFINIWMAWRMVACPPGYEDHRTLDMAAKVISGIAAGLIGLMIVANILVALFPR